MRLLSLSLLALTATAAVAQTRGPKVPAFDIHPGYKVTLAAENLGETRFMQFDDKGTLYVSQPRNGNIITLRDTKKNGQYEKVNVFTSGKPTVHGMDFADGWLWFTQSGAIWKARDTNGDGKADEEIKVVDGLPNGGGHWWRSIAVSPTHFYTSIGDNGNINDPEGTDRQKIWMYNLDGSGKTLFASGLRNTEKLRIQPGTQEIWGADHGSDWFGGPLGDRQGNQPITDNIPPCEFNHYVQDGFYGHPFVVGNGMPRIEFKDRPDILDLVKKTILPAWPLGAHWAPNGWCFAEKDAVGAKGDAYIACHGSWNSSKKVGYRVERIFFDPATKAPYGSQPVVITMTPEGRILDRPVDCVEAPDGAILFTTDANCIYRVTRAS